MNTEPKQCFSKVATRPGKTLIDRDRAHATQRAGIEPQGIHIHHGPVVKRHTIFQFQFRSRQVGMDQVPTAALSHRNSPPVIDATIGSCRRTDVAKTEVDFLVTIDPGAARTIGASVQIQPQVTTVAGNVGIDIDVSSSAERQCRTCHEGSFTGDWGGHGYAACARREG